MQSSHIYLNLQEESPRSLKANILPSDILTEDKHMQHIIIQVMLVSVTSPEALKGSLLLLMHSCYIIPRQMCPRESASDHKFLPASEVTTIIYLHPAPSGTKMPALCDRGLN